MRSDTDFTSLDFSATETRLKRVFQYPDVSVALLGFVKMYK